MSRLIAAQAVSARVTHEFLNVRTAGRPPRLSSDMAVAVVAPIANAGTPYATRTVKVPAITAATVAPIS